MHLIIKPSGNEPVAETDDRNNSLIPESTSDYKAPATRNSRPPKRPETQPHEADETIEHPNARPKSTINEQKCRRENGYYLPDISRHIEMKMNMKMKMMND
jgi:hypothetical protein